MIAVSVGRRISQISSHQFREFISPSRKCNPRRFDEVHSDCTSFIRLLLMVSPPFLAFLGLVSAMTIVLSIFSDAKTRGLRNLGFLLIYLGSLISVFLVGWKPVLAGWTIFGVASGALYYAYELFVKLKLKQASWPSPTTMIHGLFMWPIMLPESVEYFLADLGILDRQRFEQDDESGA